MISAVSSQTPATNPAAYLAPADDDSRTQSAPEATSDDSGRDPATQVSLSQEAKDHLMDHLMDRLTADLKQNPQTARQTLDAFSKARADRLAAIEQMSQAQKALGQASLDAVQVRMEAIHHQVAINQVNRQLKMLERQDEMNKTLTATLQRMKESYAHWQNAKPVPAVQLTDAQIADILKKVASQGIDPSKIGGADNYLFGYEGMQYTFKKDGTAWVNAGGIPTSEAQKQGGLRAMEESMRNVRSRMQDTGAAREGLIAQLNALTGP